MRYFFGGKLYWVALGAGVLLLAGGISVSLWLGQHDGGPGPALAANEEPPAGLETGVGEGPLHRPTGNTTSDLVKGDASRGTRSSQTENVLGKDTGETRLALSRAASATLSDSAELVVQPGKVTPPRGAQKDVARIQDRADLVVRNASGKVEQRETAR